MNQLRAVQENYLHVVNPDYFVFNEVTEDYEKEMKLTGEQVRRIEGHPDIVHALSSDYARSQERIESLDHYNILTKLSTRSTNIIKDGKQLTEINIIIPDGQRKALSLDTKTKGRMQL